MTAPLLRLVSEIWRLTAEMAPYLLLGFFLAGVLSVFIREDRVVRWLGGRGLGAVLRAALVGVPMPLCSCGVIPVAASLRRHGAGAGATISFLASTPQTGVDSIAATWGMLGPLFAWIRVLIAFVSGTVAGLLANAFDRSPAAPPPPSRGSHEGNRATSIPAGQRIRAALAYGFVTLPRDIGLSLLIGLTLGGVISVVLPSTALAAGFEHRWLAYLVALLVAVPMYVCSTGSIPLAAAMVGSGISPGAALVFLIAGPATNTATIATTLKLFGSKITAIYLFSLILCALGAGFLLDTLAPAEWSASIAHRHPESIGWFHHLSGAILLAICAANLLPMPNTKPDSTETRSPGEETLVAGVDGMSCSHCAASVQKALCGLPGVTSVAVDLSGGVARIVGRAVNRESVATEIRALGFEVRGVERLGE